MNPDEARALIEAYVDGWRRNDGKWILSTLTPDCLIIESHGPTFRGIESARGWVERWIADGSRVDRWDITSFCAAGDAAVFEWRFECTVAGQHYDIDGISWAEFAGGRIAIIREYRRTEVPYDGLVGHG